MPKGNMKLTARAVPRRSVPALAVPRRSASARAVPCHTAPSLLLLALTALALALAFLTVLPATAHGQTAAELLKGAMDAQADRLTMVDDVTITQEVMGLSVGLYMEKRVIDDTPVLFPVSTIVGHRVTAIPEHEMAVDWSNPFQRTWVERVRLAGTDEVDGRRVHVLVIDDFSSLDLPSLPGQPTGHHDFRPRSLLLFLDEDHLIRKVEIEAEVVRDDGSSTPVHIGLFMEDYREVNGYLHPFRTRTVTKGMLEAVDVDQDELRLRLEELKSQLESMPEDQRAVLEGILGPQIRQLQTMLSSAEGDMELTITVTDLQVNTGPPRGSN